MKNSAPDSKCIVNQFDSLQTAIIDASSVIYLEKTGILQVLSKLVCLQTVQSVFDEIGFYPDNISCLKYETDNPTDTQLVDIAGMYLLPLISEDRRLLRRAEERSIAFFNSLMMLNLVYFRNGITSEEYRLYAKKLREIARYSNAVWLFGESVFTYLSKKMEI